MTLYEEICHLKNAQPKNLKFQCLAQKEDIIEVLELGCTRIDAWKALQASGKFSGNYSSFCRHVRSIITETQSKPKMVNSPLTPEKTQPTKPKNKFNWTPNYDAKELTG
ncbi:TraK family protein [Moritella viscosa]|uniref:TraK family protein n=1 Tax=Moritella viscosa TaxID=80854 RepID=UPI00094DD879|nr:TraK family protein [Moritella viscosa]